MKVLSILAFLDCAAIARAPQRTRQQVVAQQGELIQPLLEKWKAGKLAA